MSPKAKKGFKKRQMDVEEESEEEEWSAKKGKKKKKGPAKEGYLLKKKMKTVFKSWEQRYVVLEDNKVLFYTSEDRKTLKKTIDLST